MDERDRIKGLASKDKLEQYLIKGQGVSELKKEEKALFLGEFRERVLKALTIPQLHEQGTYKEIEDAIKDTRSKKLVINRKADLKKAAEYIRLAKQNNVSFTTVEGDSFKGDLGLVVAAERAVDIEDVLVKTRREKLLDLGLPEKIVDNPGLKVCKDCYNKIKELAPYELRNYSLMTLLDKLKGTKCTGC
ncbi:YueI family protein [Alkalicella caledoniensis]|uniref:YueI family protein n=1 Tax=Alkalicella caledoniensis TaxID=2731377 RepID=A0A7G9W914_ALKCA|nr:YueI family protein [Alkalicella caledoniensis]QNO15176.1 YueI family protein [Alkalicella caledoniensis]